MHTHMLSKLLFCEVHNKLSGKRFLYGVDGAYS